MLLKKKMKSFDFVIIGGGAAGMAAAISCKQKNEACRVLILEKKSELGKKILATGNGRCNISNVNYRNYRTVKKFIDSVGIITKEENEGRLYPHSESAKDVRDLFIFRLKNLGVEVFTGCDVKELKLKSDALFCIRYEDAKEKAKNMEVWGKKLLIATGGKAAPQFGSTGDGYVFARKFGHSVTKLRPVLTSVVCNEKFEKLKGVRTFAEVSLLNKNSKVIHKEKGEVQFTDYGLSGICIFNLSGYVMLKDLDIRSIKEAFSDYEIALDLMPNYSKEDLMNLILQRLAGFEKSDIKYLLTSMLPAKLSDYILNKNLQSLKTEGRKVFAQKIVNDLKFMKFEISELRGWNHAQCTGGGISAYEHSFETFESNLVRGLYFAGEILDYDAVCGGYNLSNAFYTGICVGSSVGECIE